MNITTIRALVAVIALFATLCITNSVRAQCCGAATTAFYQPAAYTAYSPVAYTANTGWYPGYFLDRIRARLWGAPATYVAAYPSTYVASYPTYTAGYAVASAPYTASFAPCTTCGPTQQVTLSPVQTACCDPCSSCSGCSSVASYGVSQTSYQAPSGCACNGQSGGTPIVTPSDAVLVPGSQQPPSNGQQPQLPRTFETTPRSSDRPLSNGQELEPEPVENNGTPAQGTPENSTGGTGAYLEPPLLFSPTDRAARRETRPIQLALYDQPVGHQRVSHSSRQITPQQAERDAAGWRSASN